LADVQAARTIFVIAAHYQPLKVGPAISNQLITLTVLNQSIMIHDPDQRSMLAPRRRHPVLYLNFG